MKFTTEGYDQHTCICHISEYINTNENITLGGKGETF